LNDLFLKHPAMTRILFLLTMFTFLPGKNSFRKEQQRAPKVFTAYQEKWPELKSRLHGMGVDTNTLRVFLRVFKSEKMIEMWVKGASDKSFQRFAEYPICASSGELGPKRKQGDGQVPEGFYAVSVFNPYSNYYVSLGLNYPNKSDRILGGKGDLGGAIMIHGNCVTIGCMPITDDKIKEVYVLAAEARNDGQEDIPVHVFPVKLNDENMKALEKRYSQDQGLLAFWRNLKTGFDYFEGKKKLPVISVAADGSYLVK
jgi:murein L,D-transpeptidase YafK